MKNTKISTHTNTMCDQRPIDESSTIQRKGMDTFNVILDDFIRNAIVLYEIGIIGLVLQRSQSDIFVSQACIVITKGLTPIDEVA